MTTCAASDNDLRGWEYSQPRTFAKTCSAREAELTERFLPDLFLGYHGGAMRLRHLSGPTLAECPEPCPRAILSGARDDLAALHAAGMVHGDVQPRNLIYDGEGGRWRLIDLGASRPTNLAASLGPGGFCAPEHVFSAPETPATDLYCLGLVLYRVIAGRTPWEGGWLAAAHGAASGVAPEMPDHPLSGIVRRCLQPDPRDRFPAAESLPVL
jgi:serine/threonine protein kinase